MGRVKDFYHEEICARASEGDPEPSDLEMLQIDAEMALERYMRALVEHHKQRGNNEPV